MTSQPFASREIEAGRRLFAGDWQFAAAAAGVDHLPRANFFEIAFAGRSNCGKSSLINALTSRKGLARTSSTPGRTQELIFFGKTGGNLTLVDMPGYGYAAAPKARIAAWQALIAAYLRGRRTLGRVYVLVDARHGLKDVDIATLKDFDRNAVSYQVVLTKADEVGKAQLAETLTATEAALRTHPAAYPQVLATSADKGTGLAELRAAIARLMAEKAG